MSDGPRCQRFSTRSGGTERGWLWWMCCGSSRFIQYGAARLRKHEFYGGAGGVCLPGVQRVERGCGRIGVPSRQHLSVPWLHGGQWLLRTLLPVHLSHSGLLLLHSLVVVGLLHHGLFSVEFGDLRGVSGTSPAHVIQAEELFV